MPDALRLILAFAVAAALIQLILPLAIRLANATGFVDRPVGYKRHGRATPYLGGLGLMAAVLPAGLVLGGGTDVLVILACAAGLCVVGLIDDVVVVPREPVRVDTDTSSSIAQRPGGSAANTAA